MSLNLSIKDINSLRYLYAYLNVFLVTPWYDFHKNVRFKPVLSKLYGCCLLLTQILHLSYIALDKSLYEMSSYFLVSQKIIYAFTFINLTSLIGLTVAKSAFLDAHKWKILFRNFRCIDVKLGNQGKKERKILKNIYFKCLLNHVVFVVFAAYQARVWQIVLKMSLFRSFLLNPSIQMYYEFLIVILITNLVNSFKSRYRGLNDKLVRIHKGPKFLEEFRNLTQTYRLLGETLEIFNQIFGYQLILIILHCGLHFVSSLNFLLVALRMHNHDVLRNHHLIVNICMCLFLINVILMLIIPMDSTIQESHKFLDLCCKTQDHFYVESKEMEVLTKLTNYSRQFFQKFSAAGFFDINKSVIFGLIGNVTTYIIISMQFNEDEYRQFFQKLDDF